MFLVCCHLQISEVQSRTVQDMEMQTELPAIENVKRTSREPDVVGASCNRCPGWRLHLANSLATFREGLQVVYEHFFVRGVSTRFMGIRW
jgi:N-dimethylarginine dimethylaminohydrolase